MRSFLVAAIAALAALATVQAAPKSLPASWPTCKKADPKLGECIRDAILVAVKDLSAKGAKEFGVYPIDPLIISAIDIDKGTGPVAIELHFTDLHIHGLHNAKVEPLIANPDRYMFRVPVTIPGGITAKGQYKVDGKVLILPITGQGPCDLRLDNITAVVDLQGKESRRNNLKYMEVESFKFNFETSRLTIKLENLFNGNKQLSDQMNTFLNQNWPDILNELKPAIQQAFGAAFGDVSNRIFSRVPYNTIIR